MLGEFKNGNYRAGDLNAMVINAENIVRFQTILLGVHNFFLVTNLANKN